MWGNLSSTRLQLKTQHLQRLTKRRDAERSGRQTCYLELLDTARRMRFAARPGREHSVSYRDELGTTLSRLVYEVEMTAPVQVVQTAQHLARATRDYLRSAVEREGTVTSPDAPELNDKRVAAREAADAFISAARTDLLALTEPMAE